MYAQVALVLAAAACGINGENTFIPSYITPCNFHRDFAGCVRRQIELSLPHFTKGIPELGVPSIDPVRLEDIHIDGPGLQLVLADAFMYGLSDSQLTDLKVNVAESKFTLAFKTNITVRSNYNIDGQILILPIKGKGEALIEAKNIEVVIKSKLNVVKGADGEEHFKLASPGYTYEIERTTFHFQNLFSGNKQLSEVTHKFANDNWRQLMDDLAPPAVKQIVRNTIRVINKFFARVPINSIVEDFTSMGTV